MDKEKFISIIGNHKNLIYKICRTYCSDANKRKDLEQEILIQLWNAYPKFDGRVKITTWLYKVALNTAISFYRMDIRYTKNLIYFDRTVISEIPDTQTVQNDNSELLYKYIDQFSEFDKALMLLYLDDLSYKDIAGILGITESNVGTKLNRIRQTLKHQFKKL
ncbi:RNA polymerase sigma factor [Saccharicrinis sp. FJH2]|uniref:RNA polymerase sigma factor n=1 Tax=Saccharicrinis sp. FJH65 TaxID=3344659 RepID=UPI0035F3E457